MKTLLVLVRVPGKDLRISLNVSENFECMMKEDTRNTFSLLYMQPFFLVVNKMYMSS